MIIKMVEHYDYKITVEELQDKHGSVIATFWDKTRDQEHDRKVYKFETYGGAIDQAFELLAEANNLFVRRHE